jgi:hypothetical protein
VFLGHLEMLEVPEANRLADAGPTGGRCRLAAAIVNVGKPEESREWP